MGAKYLYLSCMGGPGAERPERWANVICRACCDFLSGLSSSSGSPQQHSAATNGRADALATASHRLLTIAALVAALAAAMHTIGAGIDQALTMLPRRQLLHKLLSQPLLLPSLMAPSSAPLPLSSQPFSSCYLQMCGQCGCAVLACEQLLSWLDPGSNPGRADPLGGFFLFSMTVDIVQVRTARTTVLA